MKYNRPQNLKGDDICFILKKYADIPSLSRSTIGSSSYASTHVVAVRKRRLAARSKTADVEKKEEKGF